MVSMSRLGLLLFFMCCSGLIFSSHCAGESLFDGFWDEGTKEDIDNSLPAVREVRDDEAEQEIDIQSEMLQRMADEEQLEVRSPLIGGDALGKVKSGPLPHVMLQAFDTDGDGVLSPEERAKIDKKAWIEFHKTMRSKATNAINHAMPTLKEMKMHLQQARFEGKELPKDVLSKQKLQEKIDEHMRMVAAKPTVDPHPNVQVGTASTSLHKRSLEHAKLYSERSTNQK